MKLPAIPVHSFEDATLNSEKLQDVLTTPGTSLPFLQLAAAANRKVTFGTATITFTASQTSAGTTVTHGLGATPVSVLATMQQTVGATGVVVYVSGITSTQFTLAGWIAASVSITLTVSWVAIG